MPGWGILICANPGFSIRTKLFRICQMFLSSRQGRHKENEEKNDDLGLGKTASKKHQTGKHTTRISHAIYTMKL